MTSDLTSILHDLTNLIEQLATIYLFKARFDAALSFLNAKTLDLLRDEIEPDDWIRLQILRAGIIRYQGYCDYDPELFDDAMSIIMDVMGVAEKSGINYLVGMDSKVKPQETKVSILTVNDL